MRTVAEKNQRTLMHNMGFKNTGDMRRMIRKYARAHMKRGGINPNEQCAVNYNYPSMGD